MQRTSFVLSTRNWWRGLLPLAAIWVVTNTTMTEKIENDLARRASVGPLASNAVEASAPWATVRVAGRDVFLEGTAPAEASRIQIAGAVDNVWGVRLVQDHAKDLVAVLPFQWGAEHAGTQLKLTGYVPPGGARAGLHKDARRLFPGVNLADEMKDGGGALTNFSTMTAYSLNQLTLLTDGRVGLSDAAFSIRGHAASEQVRTAVLAETLKLPRPMTLLSADITAPPAPAPIETSSITTTPAASYVWHARRENRQVTLSGFVPDEAAHHAILATAGRQFSGLTVNDKLKLTAEGAPDGFTPAATVGLTQLARLETGSATIADKQLTLVGLAESEEIARETKAEITKVAAGFSGDATVVGRPKPVQVAVAAPTAVPVASDCTSALRSASNQSRIQFESWKSLILPASAPVIEEVANILKRCPELKVEVSGHTDNTGQAALNKALSLRRAAAVVSTLAKSGVERSRLKPEGFGATRPVSKNETHDGRAANRRIEFTVLK